MNFEQKNQAIKIPSENIHPLRKKWWNFCWWLEENNPFTKYVYVKNAEEYINLPRSKRTYLYFWYNRAICRDLNDGFHILGKKSDRNAVETFIKRKFPIQYFIRENCFNLKIKFSLLWDNFSYTINPRQKWLTKQIPKGWCDKVTLIRDINFAMVVHFVEGEKCFEHTDYENSSEGHSKFARELMECYLYIKTRRPMLEKQCWDSFPNEDERTGDYHKDYTEINRLEQELDEQDTRWLTWIITNRGYLWT